MAGGDCDLHGDTAVDVGHVRHQLGCLREAPEPRQRFERQRVVTATTREREQLLVTIEIEQLCCQNLGTAQPAHRKRAADLLTTDSLPGRIFQPPHRLRSPGRRRRRHLHAQRDVGERSLVAIGRVDPALHDQPQHD